LKRIVERNRRSSNVRSLFRPMQLSVILIIAMFAFGPKKLPELGKGLVEGIRSFRDSMPANSFVIAGLVTSR
jgi:TatA/E family protein of Tat protein translocase